MLTLMTICSSLSLIFMFLSHPISFMLTILMQTLIVSLMTGLMLGNFWFSYILFLTMIGGMLVLFLYMTNVASNEKFKFSKLIFWVFMFTLLILLLLLMIDKFLSMNMILFWNMKNNQFLTMILKFYNFPSNLIMILIMSHLLLTLVMSVKLTIINQGPLRLKF